MAVSVLRPIRHVLLFQETGVCLSTMIPPTKHCNHLSTQPLVQTHRINNTIQLRCAVPPKNKNTPPSVDFSDGQRPLAVLFGWMLAKQRHLNKYGNLYLSKGFDVLTVQVPPSQVLRPIVAQKRIASLLDTLQDKTLSSRPLLIHGFSAGGYLYGEMLVKLTKDPQYKHIRDRMVGQVFDSPVDFEGVPRGMANVLAKSPAMKTVVRKSLETYLKLLHNSVTKHYLEASLTFHRNDLRLPSLFLYSRADPIGVADIIEKVSDKWRQEGITVSQKCWAHSPHVSHFHHHPDEYVDMVLTFLDTLGLSSSSPSESFQQEGGVGEQHASEREVVVERKKAEVPSRK